MRISDWSSDVCSSDLFARLKEQAPGLLSGKTAWTTPLRFTNRLLVGPFKSEAEAQAFVNELAEVELAAFSWTSEEGQRSEEHTSELQSLMRISYAVFCLKKKKKNKDSDHT